VPRSRSIKQRKTDGQQCNSTRQKIGPRVASVKLQELELGKEVTNLLAGEDLANAQQEDPGIGPIVKMKLANEKQPMIEELLNASKQTKQLWDQWDRLVVRHGTVYRRFSDHNGRQSTSQLLVP